MAIQIQHLLKLNKNMPPKIKLLNFIQIQHLLKLNIKNNEVYQNV